MREASAIGEPLPAGGPATTVPGLEVGLGRVGARTPHFPHRLSVGEDTSVSSLWTPSGEHTPGPDDVSAAEPAPATEGEPIDEAAMAEELRRIRAELASTPVADIVANHAVGLWQLAVLHLTPEGGEPPNLPEASLAIDAMAGLVDGLGDRLGANAEPLRDALSQLRLAFVQVRDRGAASPDSSVPSEP
jgi:hypothetical protein